MHTAAAVTAAAAGTLREGQWVPGYQAGNGRPPAGGLPAGAHTHVGISAGAVGAVYCRHPLRCAQPPLPLAPPPQEAAPAPACISPCWPAAACTPSWARFSERACMYERLLAPHTQHAGLVELPLRGQMLSRVRWLPSGWKNLARFRSAWGREVCVCGGGGGSGRGGTKGMHTSGGGMPAAVQDVAQPNTSSCSAAHVPTCTGSQRAARPSPLAPTHLRLLLPRPV